jgi:hypothetical protein
MANQIVLKRSATPGKVPSTSQLALGEVAINTHDGKLFIKKDDGTPSVVEIGGVTSVNSLTGSVVLSTTEVAEGSNQYFTNSRARQAVSAGTGISYNASTGVISTTQNLSTGGTPTFAGVTLTGNSTVSGNIVPGADNVYSLGSPTHVWKDVYVGPGTLYINGSPVITDNSGTMTFTADVDQNIRLTTVGAGVLQLGSSATNVNIDGTLQIASGKNITDSAGVEVNFGDNIDMNNNKIVGLGAPSASTDAANKAYVDSQVGAISTSTISSGNSNIAVVDNGTGTVTVTVDGSTALTVTAAGVVVAGDFTVSGVTTTVNSNTVAIADNILTLNSDATGAPTQNAGLEVKRGDEANVQLRWNEGTDKWTFTNDGAVYNAIAVNTDDLSEGAANQYFTQSRARQSVSVASGTGLSYNSTTGVLNLSGIPNNSLANNSISVNGSTVSLGGSVTIGSDAVSEGSSNQYFTSARARGAVSAGTGISYNSTTGAISADTTVLATKSYVDTATANATLTSTDDLVEGAANLYFTTSRAQEANTTAIATAKSEAISAAASDATTKANAAQAAAIATASADATTKANAAQAAAISSASSDAASKVLVETNRAIAAEAALGSRIDNVLANTDAVALNSLSELVTAFQAADGNLTTSIGALSTSASSALTQEITDRQNAVTSAISAAASDATTKANAAQAAAIATASADATTKANAAQAAAIATASADATAKVAAEAAARAAAITAAVAGKDNTDEITEGSTNLYYTDARVATRVDSGLTNFHSAFQSVTSAQATTNATGTVAFTFADLATAKHYNVYVNRMLLRPTEFSVSGSTVTFVAGLLTTDDEIEVTGLKFA